jgi:hypothetical protein
MCWSKEVSISTYVIGIIGCVILYNKGYKIEALFYGWVIQMQLIEYFLWAFQPCNDENKPKIVFTDRWATVMGEKTFYLRLPITSENIVISVYDKQKGNLSKDQEKNIKLIEVKKTPLEKRLDVVDIQNSVVANFVDFAQRFSYNAPYLADNKTYQSDNGEFLIEYLPVIISSNQGKELTTPARISRITGRIQVAKKYFDKYTVPMRFAILCHEFSHFYVNDDIDNESEADINGLLICRHKTLITPSFYFLIIWFGQYFKSRILASSDIRPFCELSMRLKTS